MKLAISLATRKRPRQVVETISRSVQNWSHHHTEMWVMADRDDPETIEALTKNTWPNVRFDVREREDSIAAKWNRVIKLAPDAELFLVAADDDPYITPGYDSKLVEAAERLPDDIGVVYGHMANPSFSGVVAPTRKLVEKLGGQMFVEHFPYWFVDHWLDDVVRMIDRISFADVRTDQSKAGKTQEMREPGWWATFFDAAYLVRRRQAFAIINDPEFLDPEWRKEMLLHNYPLVEYRSRWVNDTVRHQANQLDAWSGLSLVDPRYQSKRDKAVQILPAFFEGMDETEAQMYRAKLTPMRATKPEMMWQPAVKRLSA